MGPTATEALNADAVAIHRAFTAAQLLRPYKGDPSLLAAIIPAGGHWQYARRDGQVLVTWNGLDVACVNPAGHLPPGPEDEISMALQAMPAMDAALRIILAIAKSPVVRETEAWDLIARVAETVIAYIETPVPGFAGPIEEDDPDKPCSNPGGHEWSYSGTAYGGDDPSYHGEGRVHCVHCGADGDA